MRSPASLLACLAVFATALPAFAEGTTPAPAPAAEVRLESVYLEATGVEAPEADPIVKTLERVPGVRSLAWTRGLAEVKVVREVGKAPDAELAKAMTSAGAETASVVPLAATTFVFDKKLHCGGCVAQVNKAMRGTKGVKESTVPEDMATVTVVYDTRAVKPAYLEEVLGLMGKPAKAK